jgi:hypothetical protein
VATLTAVNRRAFHLSLLGASALLVGAAVRLDVPLCPMASSLGVPCPGCGLTRATVALLHGDLHAALHLHPLVWLLTPLFVSFMAIALWELLRDPSKPRAPSRIRWHGRGTTLVASVVLVLTFGVWAARFAGYFGGPVPVTTLHQWLRAR